MRTIVTIPDNQLKIVDMLCKEQHISRAELVRASLDLYIKKNRIVNNSQDAFGILKNRQVDGLAYQNNIREEW